MKLMIIIHYKYSSLRNRLQFATEITANIRQLIHFLPPPSEYKAINSLSPSALKHHTTFLCLRTLFFCHMLFYISICYWYSISEKKRVYYINTLHHGTSMKQPCCLVLKLKGNSICTVGDLE